MDEPVASLDPLARREFLQDLMTIVAEHGVSVVLSSHLIADLERVCDYVVALSLTRERNRLPDRYDLRCVGGSSTAKRHHANKR